jgi:hypothetical protein
MHEIDSPEHEALYIQEPEAVTSSVDRINKHILDAKYERANLREIAQSAEHLCQRRGDRLYTTLKRHEELFDGSLGKWNMQDYEIELPPDAKPYHAKAFPIPQTYTATLKMEVERLCKVGVLKQVNSIKGLRESLIRFQKSKTCCFLS